MKQDREDLRAAYNKASVAYRKRYDRIPARVDDIETAFSFCDVQNPFVLEIGCAYGREAQHVLTKTDRYKGIDISDSYIEMAKNEIPNGDFEQADIIDYEFPTGIDIVLAFASLLHIDKENLQVLFNKIAKSLNLNGIIFLSLKKRDEYCTEVETDDLVSRQFFYYNRDTILNLTEGMFEEVFYEEQSREVEWFTMILRKV